MKNEKSNVVVLVKILIALFIVGIIRIGIIVSGTGAFTVTGIASYAAVL